MSNTVFIPGEIARLSLAITNEAGAAADPGALSLKVKPPTGAVQTFVYGVDVAVVRDSVGAYHVDLPLPANGSWAYRWELTGANAGASEGHFLVAPSIVL